MILVIAPTHIAWELYRDQSKLPPTKIKWVHQRTDLLGYNEAQVVAVGNWWESGACTDLKIDAHNLGYVVTEVRL